LAARLVDLLSRTYLADGHVINTDVSVGVSVIPAGGEDCDKILNNADLALSHARQDGLGRFRLFETAMDAQREARRSLAVDLRRALALRELTLAYQPQFNLGSEHITGFEALLRWRHPKRGFVSPADFIPLAEEIGLIAPIGEWVLRKACREAANWPDSLRVAVNVSAVQFRNTNLCEQVEAALADSGLDPGRLELEITESVLIGDHASVLSALHRLQEMGVRISMDDFGTGYSSLSYLHSFPFDKIKIDQSFVRGAINEASSTAIIRAIAVLGRSLGMTTTAEGVETDAQLNRVREAGCIDVQGYLISRPMPPENIELFLQSRKHSAAAE
jgi:predicted signal transduction protein with EAL and GGDEF domain